MVSPGRRSDHGRPIPHRSICGPGACGQTLGVHRIQRRKDVAEPRPPIREPLVKDGIGQVGKVRILLSVRFRSRYADAGIGPVRGRKEGEAWTRFARPADRCRRSPTDVRRTTSRRSDGASGGHGTGKPRESGRARITRCDRRGSDAPRGDGHPGVRPAGAGRGHRSRGGPGGVPAGSARARPRHPGGARYPLGGDPQVRGRPRPRKARRIRASPSSEAPPRGAVNRRRDGHRRHQGGCPHGGRPPRRRRDLVRRLIEPPVGSGLSGDPPLRPGSSAARPPRVASSACSRAESGVAFPRASRVWYSRDQSAVEFEGAFTRRRRQSSARRPAPGHRARSSRIATE